MWIVFMLAALVMLVGGVGGTIAIEREMVAVPQQIMDNLPFIKDLVMTGGLSLCLLGIATVHRKLRNVGRRRSSSGRSGRTRAIDFPKKSRQKKTESEASSLGSQEDDALPDELPASEQPTLLFSDPNKDDDEPGTRKMRRIGRR